MAGGQHSPRMSAPQKETVHSREPGASAQPFSRFPGQKADELAPLPLWLWLPSHGEKTPRMPNEGLLGGRRLGHGP